MTTYVVIGVVALVIIYFIAAYNVLVQLKNRVANGWSQIDVQLKRRHDLIPNLVETVKGYMDHERELLTAVTEARTRASGTAGAGTAAAQAQAESALSGALVNLLAVAENYPQLKADANFRALQEQLTDTESKIAFSRQFYNDTVMMYNTRISVFPALIVARTMGFGEAQYFEVAGAEREPVQVKFGAGGAGA